MKLSTKITAAFTSLALVGATAMAQQGPGGNGNAGGSGGNGGGGTGGGVSLVAYIDSLPMQTLDAAELDSLMFMREEEKVARDVYRTLYETWSVPVFDNIAQSEQDHMDLTLIILDRYGLPDPVGVDIRGVFQNPVLQSVHDRLVRLGQQSVFHAMLVGAIIEDFDIFDLDLAIAATDNLDYLTVLQNLERGSRNHMRAFYGQLERLGYTFRGLQLSYAEILAIVSTPVEPRPVDENGDPL